MEQRRKGMKQDAIRRHPRKTRPGGRRAERGAGGKGSRGASAAAAWPTCDVGNVNESRREWECADRLWHRSEGREFLEKSWTLINRHKQGCRLCSQTLFGHRFGRSQNQRQWSGEESDPVRNDNQLRVRKHKHVLSFAVRQETQGLSERKLEELCTIYNFEKLNQISPMWLFHLFAIVFVYWFGTIIHPEKKKEVFVSFCNHISERSGSRTLEGDHTS